MKRYMDLIDSAPLISQIDTVLTTGDTDYPGTAVEVWEPGGRELFHIVVDSSGERHVMFLAQRDNYRISLARLEEIVAMAKGEVRFVDET